MDTKGSSFKKVVVAALVVYQILLFDLAKNKAFYEKLDKGNIFSWRFNLDSSLIFISLCICAENQDIKIYSYDNQKFKLISLDLLHKFSLNK